MKHYRISVGGSSLAMWCDDEAVVLRNARITARLTGQVALVVQVLPDYRVVATVLPDEEIEDANPVDPRQAD
jgi:hypothetical protein